MVVTVPSPRGLSVGATAGVEGPAMNALATRSDGAIVQSGAWVYVFAGGRAFGSLSRTALALLRAVDPATPLQGSVDQADTNHALANGVLITDLGKVYVAYQQSLFLFNSSLQLRATRYGALPPCLSPSPTASPPITR